MAPRSQVVQSQLSVPVLELPRAPRVDVSSGLIALAEHQQKREARQVNDLRLEANTKLEELAGEADKQPWDQRATFFEKGAQQIRQGFSKRFGFLDGEVRAGFEADFGQLLALKSVDVKHSALKGEREHNVAVLEESLTGLSRQAAQAGSPAQRDFFMAQAGKAIANAMQAGGINEVQAGDYGRDFRRGVDKNVARALIENDPSGGLAALQDTAQFANLKEEDRLALVSRAESKIQHRVAMADHAAVVAERQRHLIGDQIAKEGFDLLAAGQLNEKWLDENRRVLDTADYRTLRNGMQEGGGSQSATTLSNLYRGVYVDGTDIAGDTLAALERREITAATAKQLLDENKSTQGTKSPSQRARSYITQYLKPSDINPSIAQAQQHAEAMAEFDRRIGEDPKQDAMELAREVVKRNSIEGLTRMTLTMPLPRHAVGGRTAFDVKASRAATTKAFMEKHGGNRAAVKADPDFVRELRTIQQWEDEQRRFDAANTAATDKKAK